MATPQKLLAALLIASVLVSCSSKEKKADEKKENISPIAVKLATPLASSDNSIAASGQVEASHTVNISTRVMGYITAIKVKVGDQVAAGQLLATISNTDILSKRAQVDAMITEAEAALHNAQKDLDRFTALNKQQSATAKELDNVTLQYNSFKAKLEAAKQMRNEVNASLAYTSLTAPFSGVVTQKLMEAGSIANPGMPILIIEQGGSLQISVNIPESEIQHIHLNDAATVSISSINKNFQSKIIQINPSSQFSGGQYVVKVAIPEAEKKQLYSGMYVNLTIPLKEKVAKANTNVIMVPNTSIVHKDQLTGLYTVSNGTALLRWVRLGKIYGDNVEVLSGLAANEEFIVNIEGKLFNGAPVTVSK